MFYFSISTDINSPFSHSAKVVRTLSSTASSVVLAWFFNFNSCRNVCSFIGLFISLELSVCVWTNSNRRFAIDNAYREETNADLKTNRPINSKAVRLCK